MVAVQFRIPPPLPPAEQIALAVIPKITSVPSFLGSLFIIHHVLRSEKRKSKTYHRLLFGMATQDLIFAVWSFGSSWWIPKGTPFVYGAAGTTTSCTISGFLGQGSGLSSILYNGSLSLFFLLTVRYGWSARRMKSLENALHAIPLLIGWGTAIAGLPLKLYNSIGVNCWIAAYPLGCQQSFRQDDKDDANFRTCARGDNAFIYRWAFYHAELWSVWIFSLWAMLLIYLHVRKRELASQQYRNHPPSSVSLEGDSHHVLRNSVASEGDNQNVRISRSYYNKNALTKSRMFAVQATFFVVMFCVTWIWSMVNWVIESQRGYLIRPILYLMTIFVPSQGLFDFLIYIRPRVITYCRRNPNRTWRQLLHEAVFDSSAERPIVASSGHPVESTGTYSPDETNQDMRNLPDNANDPATNDRVTLEHPSAHATSPQVESTQSQLGQLSQDRTIIEDMHMETQYPSSSTLQSVPLYQNYNEYFE